MNRNGRYLTQIAALSAVYTAAGKLGLSLAFLNASATAVWPPAGIALASLLLWGRRLWPGIFLGAFLVNISTQGNAWTALAIASGNTLEALLGAILAARYADGPRAFDRPATIFRYVVGAALLCTMGSATLGAASLCLGGFAPWSDLRGIWLTWWLGDAASDLTIAPLLVIWLQNWRGLGRFSINRWGEALALAMCVALVGHVVFMASFDAFGGRKNPLGYLSLLPLVWAAFRFGPAGAIAAAVAMTGVALWGTLHELGPFVTPDMNLSLLLLQAFIGISTITVLVLAAMVQESQRAEERLRAENTQRREAEEARRQTEERFRLAASSEVLTLYEQDASLRYTWLYPMHPEHSGALGKTDDELLPAAEGQLLTAYKREVMASGVPQHREVSASLPSGVRYYAMSICPRRNAAGQIVGVAGAALDISQRVFAEQTLLEAREHLAKANEELEARVQERTASLQAALEQMEEFSYTISHDLRAPLRGMQGYSQALLEDFAPSLAPEAVTYTRRIADNAARLDKMILDVLTFSRVARANLVLERVSLDRLIHELIRHYPSMQPPHARIDVKPLLDVLGHEPSLTQVISNLLGNAIKFVRPGDQPHIQIWSESRDGQVRVYIQDNGIGVQPKSHHRLFRMFDRVHPDLKYDGTGVGLAIVKKAVERMGGRVGVESDGVNGSCFWFELRAAE